MFRVVPALLGLVLAAAACSPATVPPPSSQGQAQPPKKLVMAVLPTGTPEKLASDAKEIEEFLSQRVGADVDLIFPTTYAGVIEALRFGHAQAAFMSAWPAALAQKHAGAEVALAEVREVAIDDKIVEAPYYYSYWVVRKDSPAASLEDLRGKKASLPSPLSTSGYVAPVGRMVELGLLSPEGKEADPKKFFSDVLFAGGYAQGWEALKSGQVDATVIAGDVSEKLYREVLSNTKIVEKQGPVPSHAVVFAKDLEDPLRSKLRDALIDLGDPARRDLMRKFISAIFVGFKPTTTEEHLGSLNRYLKLAGAQFTERLG